MFNGTDYVVPSDTYALEFDIEGEEVCINLLMEFILPGGEADYMILGDAFLREYYAYFDVGNFEIGFANL